MKLQKRVKFPSIELKKE